MEWTERIIPDETEKGILSVHLKRYAFAYPRSEKKALLDVGCGAGYGSFYLSEIASRVTAVDSDFEAIQYAKAHFGRENVKYLAAEAEALPFFDCVFDIVCSFEAIEHTRDSKRFLAEAGRLLKPDGLFFVSTPSARHSGNHSKNHHHHQEWSSPDFKALLEQYFTRVDLHWQVRKQTRAHRWLQRLDFFNWRERWMPLRVARAVARMTNTAAFADLDLGDIEIQPQFSENALSQIGVCSGPKVPSKR